MASPDQEIPEGTLKNILDQNTLKWVFVGGKGGVGKTTCSSILAILLASVRSSVLIISTDPAHNLSDAFQQRFTKAPTLVNGFTNLFAMEVDPSVENEDITGDGQDNFVSELANAIPGIDEAMSFAEMLKLVQTMDYSVIVFDTAPTGHTLRLLQFPSTLEKGLTKLMTLKNKFGGLLSQMTRMFGVEDEFGEDAILGRLEGMKEVIEQVNQQFGDPRRCGRVDIFVNPSLEELVICRVNTKEFQEFAYVLHSLLTYLAALPHSTAASLVAGRPQDLFPEMDSALAQQLSIPEDVIELTTSNSSSLEDALQILTETSRNDKGRLELASKGILGSVLKLSQSLDRESAYHLRLLSLRLLRNLCAGEATNQNLFIELNGVAVISGIINSVQFDCDDFGYGIIRAALQVLANISLAGEKHQRAIWDRLFPDVFLKIAGVCRKETCDPLCMIIYTCSDGSFELFTELCTDRGLAVIAKIARTASEVGFGEDWLKLLISRICLEESHFSVLFSVLSENVASENSKNPEKRFTASQAYLLRMVSEILDERLKEIDINIDFALYILGIFETAVKIVDFHTRGQSGLPTGSALIDVLGYSLTVLRDTCAQDSSVVVNSLIDRGFLDLLLSLLHELELPSSIRKTISQIEGETGDSESPKVCPYKGFRRDIVAVIGNCSYRRKNVQDEVRQKNGVILLLQQCVLDEDNPFLREWGIFCAKNLLEGNAENQQVVASLEMQGTVDLPQLSDIGLRAEVDPTTKRARLEVDPSVENEDITGDGQDNFVSELANAIPGIDEAMSFAEMLKLVQTMDYSVIVFDTAPTGHTLRLLQFPSTLEKGLTKLMTLKNKFGGLLSQMTRMFGVEDEFGEDAILGRLEGMKEVIEQVNQQFRDPDLTTFVCVCIPEFLSLYETERLVQELAKFEIDTHNIIINQVLFDDEVVDSKLLKARMRMQERYIDQFYMLYEDFNISKMPLMPEEVTGLQALKSFSRHFLIPYQPVIKRGTVEELEMRIAELNRQLKDAEDELDKVRKGKQKA